MIWNLEPELWGCYENHDGEQRGQLIERDHGATKVAGELTLGNGCSQGFVWSHKGFDQGEPLLKMCGMSTKPVSVGNGQGQTQLEYHRIRYCVNLVCAWGIMVATASRIKRRCPSPHRRRVEA